MSSTRAKGDKVWTPILDGTHMVEVEIVRVIRHKGETQFVVEIRDAPDLVLAVRTEGSLYNAPPRGFRGR